MFKFKVQCGNRFILNIEPEPLNLISVAILTNILYHEEKPARFLFPLSMYPKNIVS